jgi:hypothetical protein
MKRRKKHRIAGKMPEAFVTVEKQVHTADESVATFPERLVGMAITGSFGLGGHSVSIH